MTGKDLPRTDALEPPLDRRPHVAHAELYVRLEIALGDREAGRPVSRPELAELAAVSETVAHRALEKLTADGYLEQSSKGTTHRVAASAVARAQEAPVSLLGLLWRRWARLIRFHPHVWFLDGALRRQAGAAPSALAASIAKARRISRLRRRVLGWVLTAATVAAPDELVAAVERGDLDPDALAEEIQDPLSPAMVREAGKALALADQAVRHLEGLEARAAGGRARGATTSPERRK
jgi:hypothetical protein